MDFNRLYASLVANESGGGGGSKQSEQPKQKRTWGKEKAFNDEDSSRDNKKNESSSADKSGINGSKEGLSSSLSMFPVPAVSFSRSALGATKRSLTPSLSSDAKEMRPLSHSSTENKLVSSSSSDNSSTSAQQDASSTSTSSAAVVESIESFAVSKKIPVSNQIDLTGHTKAVSCIAIEPAGNRLATGSLDYAVKIYDFGGMDKRHMAFKSVEAQENHFVTSISYSPSGDRFIVGTGSCQPKVYDREGNDVIKFARGDMYLRDLSNTKGHTMEVTCVQWHPSEKNTIISSSADGSIRLWNLLGEALFGNLINSQVLKIRGATGGARVGATSCCFTPDGQRIIGGASDGTIHIWNKRKIYSRPDIVLKTPDNICNGRAVTCVTVSKDSHRLAARFDNGYIGLWNIESVTTSKTPLKMISGVPNDYPSANVEFSPDAKLVCAGTTPVSSGKARGRVGRSTGIATAAAADTEGANSDSAAADEVSKSRLYFFDVDGADTAPCLSIAIATGISIIMVKWQPSTNQLFCTLCDGNIRVLYDPSLSQKGAMLSAHRAPKRTVDPSDYVTGVGEIINPHALPMYRSEEQKAKRRKPVHKDPIASHIPERPNNQGPGQRPNNNFFFTQHVMSERVVDNKRMQDPREALLAQDAAAKANPMFTGKAYKESVPQGTILHKETFEQEQEEFKKKQKGAL